MVVVVIVAADCNNDGDGDTVGRCYGDDKKNVD